jgi:hypothetical protein
MPLYNTEYSLSHTKIILTCRCIIQRNETTKGVRLCTTQSGVGARVMYHRPRQVQSCPVMALPKCHTFWWNIVSPAWAGKHAHTCMMQPVDGGAWGTYPSPVMPCYDTHHRNRSIFKSIQYIFNPLELIIQIDSACWPYSLPLRKLLDKKWRSWGACLKLNISPNKKIKNARQLLKIRIGCQHVACYSLYTT